MLVSIIVPVFNTAEYLPMCLDSILAQSYRDIEVILVDDCSSDTSLSVCQTYGSTDDRIRVISMAKNSGVSAARNLGLDSANGEVIAFCDSDDTMHEEFISCFVELLKKTDSDIVCCNYEVTHDPHYIPHRKVNGTGLVSVFPTRREAFIAANGGKIGSECCTKAFRRSLVEDNRIRFRELHTSEDYVFLIDCIRHCKKVCHIDYCHYFYYKRPSSQMNAGVNDRSMDFIAAYDIILDIARAYFPSEVNLVMAGRAWSAASRLMRIDCSHPTGRERRKTLRRLIRESGNGLFDRRYPLKFRVISFMMLLVPRFTTKLCGIRRSLKG